MSTTVQPLDSRGLDSGQIRPAPSKSLVVRAVQVLLMIFEHVAMCAVVTWLANFGLSRGNFLSSVSIRDQPRSVFILALLLWSHTLFFWTVISLGALNLWKRTFVHSPDRPTSFAYCCWRLLRTTFLYCVLVWAMDLGVNQFISVRGVEAWPPLAKLHLEFYIGSLLSLLYFTAAAVAARTIYKTETVEGRATLRPGSSSHRRGCRLFLRILLQCSVSSITFMLAGLYVQLSSRIQPGVTSGMGLLLFSGGSLVLKLVLQELTKRLMLVKKVQHTQTIYVLVALPTVLIDTQVRLVVQQLGTVRTKVSSVVVMALLELMLRFGKLAVLRLDIIRHHRVVSRHRTASAAALKEASKASTEVPVAWTSPGHPVTDLLHVERLATLIAHSTQAERRLLRYHAAESYADMVAEYIAIACSASIWFFYGQHPKYQLAQRTNTTAITASNSNRDSGSSNAESSYSLIASSGAWSLVAQAAIEVIVDFIACMLEIRAGIDFREIHRHRVFLGILFAMYGLLNVSIAAIMFLREAF